MVAIGWIRLREFSVCWDQFCLKSGKMSSFTPKYPAVNLQPPSADDLALDETLRAYTREAIPIESARELQVRNECWIAALTSLLGQKRQRVLANLVGIFKDWVKDVSLRRMVLWVCSWTMHTPQGCLERVQFFGRCSRWGRRNYSYFGIVQTRFVVIDISPNFLWFHLQQPGIHEPGADIDTVCVVSAQTKASSTIK